MVISFVKLLLHVVCLSQHPDQIAAGHFQGFAMFVILPFLFLVVILGGGTLQCFAVD